MCIRCPDNHPISHPWGEQNLRHKRSACLGLQGCVQKVGEQRGLSWGRVDHHAGRKTRSSACCVHDGQEARGDRKPDVTCHLEHHGGSGAPGGRGLLLVFPESKSPQGEKRDQPPSSIFTPPATCCMRLRTSRSSWVHDHMVSPRPGRQRRETRKARNTSGRTQVCPPGPWHPALGRGEALAEACFRQSLRGCWRTNNPE